VRKKGNHVSRDQSPPEAGVAETEEIRALISQVKTGSSDGKKETRFRQGENIGMI